MTVVLLIAVFVFLAASAFYSGFETGVYSLNRVRLRIRAERGVLLAGRVRALLDDMPGLLVTLLCGNNLALDGATFTVTLLLAQAGTDDPEFLATLIMTPTVFVFGEVLPKNLFRQRPNILVYPTSVFATVSKWAFLPLVWILKAVSMAADRLGPGESKGSLFSRKNLGFHLSQGVEEGVVPPETQAIASNILRISKTYLRNVMVPMEKVACLGAEDGAEELVDLARQSGRSRFPVLGTDGRVAAVVNIFDWAIAGEEAKGLQDIYQRPVEFRTEFPVDDALFILQRRKRQMAVILQPDGTPAGIITIKDLVEEIVGELEVW